jgi:hypothetical protein
VKPPRSVKPKTLLPWQLPPIEDADIFAVQAFARGAAGEAEQLRAWAVIRRIAGADRMSFWPGGEDGRRATDFAEGKRWLADQMRRLSRLKPAEVSSRGEPPPMPGANQENE